MKKYKNQYDWQPPAQEVINRIQYLYDSGFGGGKKIAKEVGVSENTIWNLRNKGFLHFHRSKEQMISIAAKKRIHSEKTKNKISIARKKFLSENPDKIPYKLNHKSKGESYPEKYFREWLEKENISFQQEYRFKLYSFDFLVNERVDLEIDGSQHKDDANILKHDEKRDAISKDNGFIVYRVMWADFQKLSQEEKKNFLSKLKNFLMDVRNPIPQFVIKKKQPKIKTKQEQSKKKVIITEDPRKKQALEMLKCGMNYCEVGREFKVSDNAIRKWIKSLGENPKDYSGNYYKQLNGGIS